MSNILKIYLGDLTYDTVVLSTNSFPLNVGYLGSYCMKRFGSDVEITLFKDIKELENSIRNSPPDILGMSNYCWNQNLGHEMFKILHEIKPNALAVWGGPNFPTQKLSQEKFLNQFPEVDIYVLMEAEIGFSNIVECTLKNKEFKRLREKFSTKFIGGCIVRGKEGKYNYGSPAIRIVDLDDIPSPYLSGLMDKFFDGRYEPMIQTNRGCPFTCSYCVDGQDQVKKVNKFSLERVADELEYIAQRIPKKMHAMTITDLNFGMIPRDLQICDLIVSLQDKYNFPEYINASTGKNSKKTIINAIKRLKGSLKLMMAVQSLDGQVLEKSNRANISVDRMMELAPAIKKSGLKTKAEVILGLPGDNFEAHTNTMRSLLNAEMDEILVFTFMLLPGSEIYNPEERKKFNLLTKYRIIPRSFAKLSDGKIVLEIEECGVGSNTMTFDEYVELRVFNFVIYATNRAIVYEPILNFLKEKKIEPFELFYKMFKNASRSSESVKGILNKFRNATTDELWDSPEEILANYRNESEYKKLLTGDAGINVLYHQQALVTTQYMNEWTEYVLQNLLELLKENNQFDEQLHNQFHAVANYCRGLSHNPLDKDRLLTNPEYEFDYDVSDWMKCWSDPKKRLPLAHFKLSSKLKIVFKLTQEQFDIVQDHLNGCDGTILGISKTLFTTTGIPSEILWRRPIKAELSTVV